MHSSGRRLTHLITPCLPLSLTVRVSTCAGQIDGSGRLGCGRVSDTMMTSWRGRYASARRSPLVAHHVTVPDPAVSHLLTLSRPPQQSLAAGLYMQGQAVGNVAVTNIVGIPLDVGLRKMHRKCA